MKKTKINLFSALLAISMITVPVFAIELNSGNIQSLWCVEMDRQCDLTSKWITSIATGTFSWYTGLRVIDLSWNTISEITTWVFSGLLDLSFLWLANNRISSIATWSFSWLASLSTLDLSNNDLDDITIAMFSGLKKLTTLYLWGNPLSFVQSWFASYFSGVKMLLVATKTDTKNTEVQKETELDMAFAFAKEYEMTYASSLDAFAPEKSVTRRALAKMLVLYMKNYKEVDAATIKACGSFTDISGETEEDQEYIRQACEYKLMWRDANQKFVAKKFNPGKVVTRAHFATILSRILWWTQNNSSDKVNYYIKHINALKEEWILTNTDPKVIEPRGFIILMLSRT